MMTENTEELPNDLHMHVDLAHIGATYAGNSYLTMLEEYPDDSWQENANDSFLTILACLGDVVTDARMVDSEDYGGENGYREFIINHVYELSFWKDGCLFDNDGNTLLQAKPLAEVAEKIREHLTTKRDVYICKDDAITQHPANLYSYRVLWSEDDQEYVGLCNEMPSLSWMSKDPGKAFECIRAIVRTVLKNMEKSGEKPPEPLIKDLEG